MYLAVNCPASLFALCLGFPLPRVLAYWPVSVAVDAKLILAERLWPHGLPPHVAEPTHVGVCPPAHSGPSTADGAALGPVCREGRSGATVDAEAPASAQLPPEENA